MSTSPTRHRERSRTRIALSASGEAKTDDETVWQQSGVEAVWRSPLVGPGSSFHAADAQNRSSCATERDRPDTKRPEHPARETHGIYMPLLIFYGCFDWICESNLTSYRRGLAVYTPVVRTRFHLVSPIWGQTAATTETRERTHSAAVSCWVRILRSARWRCSDTVPPSSPISIAMSSIVASRGTV